MAKFLKECSSWTLSIISAVFMFFPESCFTLIRLSKSLSENAVIVVNRLVWFIAIFLIVSVIKLFIRKFRKSATIRGKNFCINVVYGDIFEQNNCKKVITFDECFTTEVGDKPHQIKPNSICGQYLTKYPIADMSNLITESKITPNRKKSKYSSQLCYPSGTIIPRDEFLLAAFAKLDEFGTGHLSRDEYIDSLSVLWHEINKYCRHENVCISILGSGITRIGDDEITKQELLDIIIASYKMCSSKIKLPQKLIIVCRKSEGFSLNRIGSYIQLNIDNIRILLNEL